VLARLGAAALALAAAVSGQYPPDPKARGSIAGTVVDQQTRRPLRRVLVILQPAEPEQPGLSVTTGEDGSFEFRDLPAGRYSLAARRAGYLPAWSAETPHTRLPAVFPLLPGEHLRGLAIPMRSAGVLAGTVRFPDGEPAVGVRVELYREYFYRGRHGFERAATASTDDRGAWRVYGLAPGNYYVAAAYAPPEAGANVQEQVKLDQSGRPAPEESFVTTYYPSTPRLVEAVPLRLRPGSELGNIDIFLVKARTVRVRGELTSGLSGRPLRAAELRLRQRGPAGEAMLDAPAPARVFPDGRFEIRGLTPGAYLLVADAAEAGERLTGRVLLTVAGQALDNVALLLRPLPRLSGTVRLEEEPRAELGAVRVVLEPHSDTTTPSSAPVDASGSFEIGFVPGETYDVLVDGAPEGSYLKSARIGGFDVLATGFNAESGALPPMELLLSRRGATISGEVGDGTTRVALGATVALIPEPARGRMHHYQVATTDEHGLFAFRGVAPGRYTVLSWWDEPPCEIYALESLESCRRLGRSIEVGEGEDRFVALNLGRPGR
jgi:uncharacterized protein (DUF2141 family)